MSKRRTITNVDEDEGPVKLPASEWQKAPASAKACRDLGHSWPKRLALEFFHVERSRPGGKGKVIALERRLPCETGCGCIKITPYVLNGRGWPTPDPTRRPTVRYTKTYLLKREYPDQELPSKADWAADRVAEVPGLAKLLGIG